MECITNRVMMTMTCQKFHGEYIHRWLSNRKTFLPQISPAIHTALLHIMQNNSTVKSLTMGPEYHICCN